MVKNTLQPTLMEEAERVRQEIEEALALLQKEDGGPDDKRARLLRAGELLRSSREAASRIANSLPSHSQLQLQQRINSLQNEIESRTQQIAPVKKFSFRNRDASSSSSSSSSHQGSTATYSTAPSAASTGNGTRLYSPLDQEHASTLSFHNKTGEDVVVMLAEGSNQPVLLSNLIDCKVFSKPFLFLIDTTQIHTRHES